MATRKRRKKTRRFDRDVLNVKVKTYCGTDWDGFQLFCNAEACFGGRHLSKARKKCGRSGDEATYGAAVSAALHELAGETRKRTAKSRDRRYRRAYRRGAEDWYESV